MSLGNKIRTKKVKIVKKKSPMKKQARLSVTLTSKSEVLATPATKLSASNSVSKLTSRSMTITKPVTPKLHTDKRLSSAVKSHPVMSSEDINMKKIEQEKKVEQLKIQKAKRLYQKLKSNGFQSTAKVSSVTVKKATIPKSPKSILDKKHGAKVPSVLKKSPTKQSVKKTSSKMSLQPTIPEPFHFATDSRLKNSSLGASSSSAHDAKLGSSLTGGELAEKFMRDSRSHHVPESAAQRLTKPHSPKLQTEIRSKSAKRDRPMSHEEMEQKFMEIQQKNAFKARSLDRRIFDSRGELGVPKVPVKALTIPMDIELQTEKRATSPRPTARHSMVEVVEDEHFEFKARPLPSTLKQPEKLATPPSKAHFRPTIAQSPKLHCLERASAAPARRQRPHHAVVEQEKKIAESARKASSAPLKLTQPKEFNLETSTRGEFHKQHLEEQLERERREVMSVFKAQPMPDLHKAFHPKVEHKDPTIPQPFHLHSIQLHEESLQEFAREVEEERKKTNSTFKAKPVPKTLFEAKQPLANAENKAHPTIPLPVNLESEVRAKKRQEFEEQIIKKKLEDDVLKQELSKQKEDEENRALKDIRRKSVQEGGLMFKAAPILKDDPFPVKAAPRTKQPTIPKSPAFKLKERRSNKLETPMVEPESRKLRMAAAMRTL
jgi:hypothetical protein